MENNLTAVEWLIEQLRMQTPLYTKNEMIEIAKQIDYDQKKAAWKNGRQYEKEENNYLNFNHYYNTNYKKINFNND